MILKRIHLYRVASFLEMCLALGKRGLGVWGKGAGFEAPFPHSARSDLLLVRQLTLRRLW